MLFDLCNLLTNAFLQALNAPKSTAAPLRNGQGTEEKEREKGWGLLQGLRGLDAPAADELIRMTVV